MPQSTPILPELQNSSTAPPSVVFSEEVNRYLFFRRGVLIDFWQVKTHWCLSTIMTIREVTVLEEILSLLIKLISCTKWLMLSCWLSLMLYQGSCPASILKIQMKVRLHDLRKHVSYVIPLSTHMLQKIQIILGSQKH